MTNRMCMIAVAAVFALTTGLYGAAGASPKGPKPPKTNPVFSEGGGSFTPPGIGGGDWEPGFGNGTGRPGGYPHSAQFAPNNGAVGTSIPEPGTIILLGGGLLLLALYGWRKSYS